MKIELVETFVTGSRIELEAPRVIKNLRMGIGFGRRGAARFERRGFGMKQSQTLEASSGQPETTILALR